MIKVFIDGSQGTTGLRINERIKKRNDIELLEIDPEKRKDEHERKKLLRSADVAVLCLPDNAAREAVAMLQGSDTVVIDASTAHRTLHDWAYGLPELGSDFRKKIKEGKKIAVPGCHATGFSTIVYPLVKMGIMPADYPLVCHSVTGYSGGGNQMIAEYTNPERPHEYYTPRQYALGQRHKHLPEMKSVAGLEHEPVFNPIVGNYYAGMAVSVPLYTSLLRGKWNAEKLHGELSKYYSGEKLIKVAPFAEHKAAEGGFLNPEYMAGRDSLELLVFGHEQQVQIVALFDNLGKGASGAALQCLNIACGADEDKGLNI